MKNTFYCGFFRMNPVVSNPDFIERGTKLVELFLKKSDAQKMGYSNIRKVRIILVPDGEQSQEDYDIQETYSLGD